MSNPANPDDKEATRQLQQMESFWDRWGGSQGDLTDAKQSGEISQKERIAALWEQYGEVDYADKIRSQQPVQAVQLSYDHMQTPGTPAHLNGLV